MKNIKPLKDRVTPCQSKKNTVTMMLLFEKYIDAKIISINIEQSKIVSDKGEYSVNIHTNKVEKIYPDPDWD